MPKALPSIPALTLAAAVAAAILLPAPSETAAETQPAHALAMHGTPKYPAEFKHFDYVNPDAPKGGRIVQEATGSYDSFNPFIVTGTPAAGLGLIYETLLVPSADEAFTEYALLAESVTMPNDRSWVAFNLDPSARWHDGQPITPDDVIWTFQTLREHGTNFHRTYYANVTEAAATGARQVTFRFAGGTNRELPLILGQLQVLPKHYWQGRTFAAATLDPPLGSGPYRIGKFEPGRSVTYERVQDHWAADLPVNRGRHNFDEIRFDYYRDRDVATEAFKGGGFDLRSENAARRWATGYDIPALKSGRIVKAALPHSLPTGMQAFVFNARKPLFRDPRVRQAVAFAWDFEWANKTLMYGAYTRTNSYFSNSELSSRNAGLPAGEELEILERYRGRIPEEAFTTVYQAPRTDGSGDIRANLRQALQLLREAGWRVEDGKLTDADGVEFAFELLLVQPSMEKLALPLQQNLERLGIAMSVRTVDSAQYEHRTNSFDFDMIVAGFGQSLSPGNEQRDFWHSASADQPGSRNLIGVSDPAVDELVELVIAAPDRASLVARTRALDRVLLWGHYVIPHFHLQAWRLVYWNRFGRPKVTARYAHGFPTTWWLDRERDAELRAWRDRGGR